jgi:polysaccharide export outer membrane protein
MRKLWSCLTVMCAAVCLLAVAGTARAEDYVLGPDDVLSVSVWMHPELDRTLTISADGNVTLPPVGEIKADGLTAKQLGDRMADRLSSYLRQTTTVTVTVTQFMSRSVFVTGGVAKPGRYGFERIPTLLEVLGQAGGALPGVDLSSVQVLRKEGDARRTLNADLASALRTGDPSGLPALKPGDTIVIPGAAQAGAAGANEGAGVLGEVNKPGVYAVGTGLDIWNVLAAAGGLTPRGNLSDVRLLTRSEGVQNVTLLNLTDALTHGSRAPVTLKPGDVVVVMPRGVNPWSVFTNVLGLSRDALNIVVLLDYLNNRKAN